MSTRAERAARFMRDFTMRRLSSIAHRVASAEAQHEAHLISLELFAVANDAYAAWKNHAIERQNDDAR